MSAPRCEDSAHVFRAGVALCECGGRTTGLTALVNLPGDRVSCPGCGWQRILTDASCQGDRCPLDPRWDSAVADAERLIELIDADQEAGDAGLHRRAADHARILTRLTEIGGRGQVGIDLVARLRKADDRWCQRCAALTRAEANRLDEAEAGALARIRVRLRQDAGLVDDFAVLLGLAVNDYDLDSGQIMDNVRRLLAGESLTGEDS